MTVSFPIDTPSPVMLGVCVFIPEEMFNDFLRDFLQSYPNSHPYRLGVLFGNALFGEENPKERYGTWFHYDLDRSEFFCSGVPDCVFQPVPLEHVWRYKSLEESFVPLALSSIYQ